MASSSTSLWRAPRAWPGETVFVLASGPSVLSIDLSLLAGRRVIAVKSSWSVYPGADVLFFADGRWWRDASLRPAAFRGMVVTTASELGSGFGLLLMRKIAPNLGLAESPDTVALARTSTTGAINLAVHFGARRIVLLGVDGKLASDGRRHCHGLKWPWPKGATKEAFADQAAEYRRIAPSATKMGVEIVNANPDSAIDVWPKMSLRECL